MWLFKSLGFILNVLMLYITVALLSLFPTLLTLWIFHVPIHHFNNLADLAEYTTTTHELAWMGVIIISLLSLTISGWIVFIGELKESIFDGWDWN